MALGVVLNRPGLYRVALQQQPEGVYIYEFDSTEAPRGPSKDWLAPDMEGAMLTCREEYGIKPEDWKEIPHEPWHGPPQ